jgi:hypothetical protein
MIHELAVDELSEFVQSLNNKQNEIRNTNLIGNPERKLQIFTELFQMYLSYKGKLLLRKPEHSRLRNILINKIQELSEEDVAQNNEEYLLYSNELKIFVENINNGCLLQE